MITIDIEDLQEQIDAAKKIPGLYALTSIEEYALESLIKTCEEISAVLDGDGSVTLYREDA